MKLNDVKIGEDYAIGSTSRYEVPRRYRARAIEPVPSRSKWNPPTRMVLAERVDDATGKSQGFKPEHIGAGRFLRPWSEQAEINAQKSEADRARDLHDQLQSARWKGLRAQLESLGFTPRPAYRLGATDELGLRLGDIERLVWLAERSKLAAAECAKVVAENPDFESDDDFVTFSDPKGDYSAGRVWDREAEETENMRREAAGTAKRILAVLEPPPPEAAPETKQRVMDVVSRDPGPDRAATLDEKMHE